MRERFVSQSGSVSQWHKWLRRQYGRLEICGSSPDYDTNFSLKNYHTLYRPLRHSGGCGYKDPYTCSYGTKKKQGGQSYARPPLPLGTRTSQDIERRKISPTPGIEPGPSSPQSSTDLPKYYTRLQSAVARGLGLPAGHLLAPHTDAVPQTLTLLFQLFPSR